MRKSHVLVIPFPAQGHVNPLMDISRYLAKHDIKITFVNTEFNHNRVMHTLMTNNNNNNNNYRNGDNSLWSDKIHLVSIPDGLGPEEDRKDLIKLCNAILRDMPATLEELINTTNESEGEDGQITCVLLDAHMGWALEVADKMGIKGALVWPASATLFALQISMPRLINEGIIDGDNGMPIKKQMYQLSTNMPAINTTNLQWSCFLHLATNTTIYEYIRRYLVALDIADWWVWVCNSSYELEPGAFSLVPNLKPIGPFMADHHIGNVGAQFWTEDSTCLNWLDEQPVRSVIYVAFGSFTLLNQTQFDELAHGLVLSNRPFLWVDRPGFADGPGHAYPDGFPGTNGKIVEWAPQQKVLSHPAVACFLSHCGWNSTIEGLSNGVPFLCWPYFADQPMNKDFICDVWKVGLKFDSGESGIITREEVKKKVKKLLGDGYIRARSSKIKEMCVNNMAEGGRSSKNLDDFVEWLKA